MRIQQFLCVSFCSFLFSSNYVFSASALSNVNTQSFFKIYELAQRQSKLRVAVLDFDYSSLGNPQWVFYLSGGTGSSRGVSDILINKLVQTGNYSVIERNRLQSVLNEQNLGASGRLDTSTAAQIGKILGVDVIIMGSITQFDLQQRNSGVSIPIPFVGWTGTATKDSDAYVQLTLQMVDTTTGEILAALDGKGNTSQSDSAVNVSGIQGSSATSNEGKLLFLATQQAADQIIVGLNNIAAQIANAPRAISNSLIAATSNGQVILNKGSADGYQVGMKISIERVTQTIKDPSTGKVLRQLKQKIGLAEIIDVDDASSVAKILTGSHFKVGDLARPAQ